jgi:hypothetical protein
MESVLKCVTLQKNFTIFVPLRRDRFAVQRKSALCVGEVFEIIWVFSVGSFCLTLNSECI